MVDTNKDKNIHIILLPQSQNEALNVAAALEEIAPGIKYAQLAGPQKNGSGLHIVKLGEEVDGHWRILNENEVKMIDAGLSKYNDAHNAAVRLMPLSVEGFERTIKVLLPASTANQPPQGEQQVEAEPIKYDETIRPLQRPEGTDPERPEDPPKKPKGPSSDP